MSFAIILFWLNVYFMPDNVLCARDKQNMKQAGSLYENKQHKH
jgi:hypothetical protein